MYAADAVADGKSWRADALKAAAWVAWCVEAALDVDGDDERNDLGAAAAEERGT